MLAKLLTSNLGTLNLKCLNKCLKNMFAQIMSQMNWCSETSNSHSGLS